MISNKIEFPWSPNSPDLNPLDNLFFGGNSMKHIYRTQPATIGDLKSIVNDYAEHMDSEMISKVRM